MSDLKCSENLVSLSVMRSLQEVKQSFPYTNGRLYAESNLLNSLRERTSAQPQADHTEPAEDRARVAHRALLDLRVDTGERKTLTEIGFCASDFERLGRVGVRFGSRQHVHRRR